MSANNLRQSDIGVQNNLYHNAEKIRVDVIIPTLNEEKSIGQIIKRCQPYCDRVIVIDGGSDDNTIKIAENMNATVIHQNSKGKGGALREAFHFANGEIIVMLDGDGSMKPEEIPTFLKRIYSGADFVKGSRFQLKGGSTDISILHRFGNALFVILVNLIWKSNYTDLCYGYIALKKHTAKKLSKTLRSRGFNIEAEMIIKTKKLGLRIDEVPSFELKRLYGKSKLRTFRDGMQILVTILRESFS
jgi:glycosyltransferase involved in cell wall biosynthesis